MHKKLASELTSLAHSILQMRNKDNVFLLQKKAHEIYEKLSVLAYIEEYVNTTPQATETKQELLLKIEEAEAIRDLKNQLESVQEEIIEESGVAVLSSEGIVENTSDISEVSQRDIEELGKDEIQPNVFSDGIVKAVIEEDKGGLMSEVVIEESAEQLADEKIEQPFEELEGLMFSKKENEKFDETSFIEEIKTPTLEDELKDTISVDVTADLFTKIEPKKSLNDRLQNTIQIGLNDRIAFVKHLFNGDSGDFNRVVSQLNTFDTEQEAKKFINKTVKPDYNWSDKEEYEIRFLEIVERKFG